MLEVASKRVEELIPDDAAYAAAQDVLPADRRAKCAALRFKADRFASAAAGLLLEELRAAHGGTHASVSHTAGRVMAAVADGPVGCDVERIVPVRDAVVRAALSPRELAALASLSGPARDREFCRLWTRKESYVKALGTGFVDEPRTVPALADDLPEGWTIREFDFGDGSLGAVAWI